ncbi:RNA-directed DNA polymerase [Artemisia annua]|uniref:RNA-directed DNA polymerase n=1 Tax=Artemisia annua TaxID=35608 RepID=A0A2U1QNQ9_ARTAN|nr:RNA-directed DNA polymerase [Artemisia annua]
MAANGGSMLLAGVGSIYTPSLSEFYYIPSLTMNLSSVGHICNFGCDVRFSISDCFIQDGQTQEVIGTCCREGGIYVLDTFKDPSAVAASSVDLSLFWLNRSSSLHLTQSELIKLDPFDVENEQPPPVVTPIIIEILQEISTPTTTETHMLQMLLNLLLRLPIHLLKLSRVLFQVVDQSVIAETITLPFVPCALQIADVFTKPHSGPRFYFLTDKLSMFLDAAFAGTISLPFVPFALQITDVYTKPHSGPLFCFLTDKLSMFLDAALATSFPMRYLGVPVGCSMARCSNWNAITLSFASKLALWKARLLSVGGRLSLIKSVLGHLPTYYMSIYPMPVSFLKKLESMRNQFFLGGDSDDKKMSLVRWNRCLASKDLGGLGIGSIFGLNIGLLFKWIWRFFLSPSALWVKVIMKSIHGSLGGINDSSSHRFKHSTWGGILSSIKRVKLKGIDLLSYCVRKIGDGASTSFWEDTWCGNHALNSLVPRIYMLDTDRHCVVKDRVPFQDLCSNLRRHPRGARIEHVVLFEQGDSWRWTLNSASFSVASVRYLIDSKLLDTDANATCWIRYIPMKVNIFIWRLMLNKLPSRVNLDRRGIDVGSILLFVRWMLKQSTIFSSLFQAIGYGC